MKAKFIKHNNPRQALGITQKNFDNFDQFMEWLYEYVVPDFYNMPNGPKLKKKIKSLVVGTGFNIPEDLYDYIGNKIIPIVKVQNLNSGDINFWPYLLRMKYDLPQSNNNL